MSTDQPLVGYSVYRTNYGGGRIGDTVLWTDKGAAEFRLAEHKACCGDTERAIMDPKQYTLIGNGMALCDRTVYDLCDTTRRELVRRAAVDKLNEEEKEALGLLEAAANTMICYAIFDGDTPVAYGRTLIAAWQAAENLTGQKIRELRGMGWELKEGVWQEREAKFVRT